MDEQFSEQQPAQEPELESVTPEPQAKNSSRRVLWIAGILVVLALIGGVLVYGLVEPGRLRTAVSSSSGTPSLISGGACVSEEIGCQDIDAQDLCADPHSYVVDSCDLWDGDNYISQVVLAYYGLGDSEEEAINDCQEDLDDELVSYSQALLSSDPSEFPIVIDGPRYTSFQEVDTYWHTKCSLLVKIVPVSSPSFSPIYSPIPTPSYSPFPSDSGNPSPSPSNPFESSFPPNPSESVLVVPSASPEPSPSPY